MTEHVVEVNEAQAFAVRAGADWWAAFRLRYDRIGRITDTVITLGGNVCEVACDDREHAEWLAAHMVDHGGLPRTAVRVRKAGAR